MKPTLKQLSDCEQVEAKIESISRKFTEDMRKIDEDHARFMRRLNWREAFLQGVICGATGGVITAFIIGLTKHK